MDGLSDIAGFLGSGPENPVKPSITNVSKAPKKKEQNKTSGQTTAKEKTGSGVLSEKSTPKNATGAKVKPTNTKGKPGNIKDKPIAGNAKNDKGKSDNSLVPKTQKNEDDDSMSDLSVSDISMGDPTECVAESGTTASSAIKGAANKAKKTTVISASKTVNGASNEKTKDSLVVQQSKESSENKSTSQAMKQADIINTGSSETSPSKAVKDQTDIVQTQSTDSSSGPESKNVEVNSSPEPSGKEEMTDEHTIRYDLQISPITMKEISNEALQNIMNLATACSLDFNHSREEGLVNMLFVDEQSIVNAIQKLCQLELFHHRRKLAGSITYHQLKYNKWKPFGKRWRPVFNGHVSFDMYPSKMKKIQDLLQKEPKPEEAKQKAALIRRIPCTVSKQMLSPLFPFSKEMKIPEDKASTIGPVEVKFESEAWMLASLGSIRNLWFLPKWDGKKFGFFFSNFDVRRDLSPEKPTSNTSKSKETTKDRSSKENIPDSRDRSSKDKSTDRKDGRSKDRKSNSRDPGDRSDRRDRPDQRKRGGPESFHSGRPSKMGRFDPPGQNRGQDRDMDMQKPLTPAERVRRIAVAKGLNANNPDVLRIIKMQLQLETLQSMAGNLGGVNPQLQMLGPGLDQGNLANQKLQEAQRRELIAQQGVLRLTEARKREELMMQEKAQRQEMQRQEEARRREEEMRGQRGGERQNQASGPMGDGLLPTPRDGQRQEEPRRPRDERRGQFGEERRGQHVEDRRAPMGDGLLPTPPMGEAGNDRESRKRGRRGDAHEGMRDGREELQMVKEKRARRSRWGPEEEEGGAFLGSSMEFDPARNDQPLVFGRKHPERSIEEAFRADMEKSLRASHSGHGLLNVPSSHGQMGHFQEELMLPLQFGKNPERKSATLLAAEDKRGKNDNRRNRNRDFKEPLQPQKGNNRHPLSEERPGFFQGDRNERLDRGKNVGSPQGRGNNNESLWQEDNYRRNDNLQRFGYQDQEQNRALGQTERGSRALGQMQSRGRLDDVPQNLSKPDNLYGAVSGRSGLGKSQRGDGLLDLPSHINVNQRGGANRREERGDGLLDLPSPLNVNPKGRANLKKAEKLFGASTGRSGLGKLQRGDGLLDLPSQMNINQRGGANPREERGDGLLALPSHLNVNPRGGANLREELEVDYQNKGYDQDYDNYGNDTYSNSFAASSWGSLLQQPGTAGHTQDRRSNRNTSGASSDSARGGKLQQGKGGGRNDRSGKNQQERDYSDVGLVAYPNIYQGKQERKDPFGRGTQDEAGNAGWARGGQQGKGRGGNNAERKNATADNRSFGNIGGGGGYTDSARGGFSNRNKGLLAEQGRSAAPGRGTEKGFGASQFDGTGSGGRGQLGQSRGLQKDDYGYQDNSQAQEYGFTKAGYGKNDRFGNQQYQGQGDESYYDEGMNYGYDDRTAQGNFNTRQDQQQSQWQTSTALGGKGAHGRGRGGQVASGGSGKGREASNVTGAQYDGSGYEDGSSYNYYGNYDNKQEGYDNSYGDQSWQNQGQTWQEQGQTWQDQGQTWQNQGQSWQSGVQAESSKASQYPSQQQYGGQYGNVQFY